MLRILRVLAALTVCDGLRGAMSVRSGRSLRAPPSARMSAGLWQQLGGTASRAVRYCCPGPCAHSHIHTHTHIYIYIYI